MGSVIDYINCPCCNSEAMYSEFWYKRNESMEFCDQCGYSKRVFWKRDENANLITNDGTNNYDFSNLILEEEIIAQPYGSIRIEFHESVGYQCGTIENKEAYDILVKSIEDMDKEKLKSIIFSKFNSETKQIEKETLYHQK